MGSPLHLGKIASTALGASTPDEIQKILDNAAVSAGKRIWSGIIAAMTCGFGKGVVATAAIVIAAAALSQGFAFFAASALFEQGLAAGATAALSFFASGGGLLTLGLGGVMGSFMDVRREQNRINAETAAAQAAAYEVLRSRGQNVEPSAGLPATDALPQVNHAAQEMERRRSAAAGIAKG